MTAADPSEEFGPEDVSLVSDDFELRVLVDAVAAAVSVLGDYLDPRRRRQFLQTIVAKLEDHIPLDEIQIERTGGSLDEAFRHTAASHWANATGELGELARMAFDYQEAVNMFRRALRVWKGFGEQSRLDLAVELAHAAALAKDVSICHDALALCSSTPGMPTHPTRLAAARELAAVILDVRPEAASEADLLTRLRA